AEIIDTNLAPEMLGAWATEDLPRKPVHTIGLYDGRNRRLYELRVKNLDVLKELEPTHSDAWRKLDVAILQRYVLDAVIQPSFADGKEITKGYTADPKTIVEQVDGSAYQLALLLQSTPLH